MLRSAARELRATVGCAAKNNVLLFPPLLRLSLVGEVASAVENVSAAYSDTTVAPHEYFDQTRYAPFHVSAISSTVRDATPLASSIAPL